MSDLQEQLEQNFANAFDRFEQHVRNLDSGSPLQNMKELTPLTMEMIMTQWTASLNIQTKHELMRAGIDAIK